MVEKIGTIRIDSELKNVRSEIDRVDAMFAVVTGPMGNQEVNYHLNDDEQGRRTIRESLPQSQLIDESSTKSQSQHSIPLINMKVLTNSQENEMNKEIELKASDDDDNHHHHRKARFTLPEIDITNMQDKVNPIMKNIKSLKSIRKSQSTFNSMSAHNSEEEYQKSSSKLNKLPLEIPERCRPEVNQTLQHQIESLLPFYTINELAEHNHSTDAWICIFTQIYDITSLIKIVQGTPIYQQLIDHAGQDISLWFDEQTYEPRRRIDPHTHQSILLIPNLTILESFDTPFWKSNDLLIGRLSTNSRYIRLLHTSFPKQPYLLEVAEEETIGQIARKFSKYNAHIFSYIWQYNGRILDFNQTLTENGIINEESFHDQYGWRSDNENCPTILLYFSDDLTIA